MQDVLLDEAMTRAAEKIKMTANGEGFATAVPDLAARSMLVTWKRPLPPAVAALDGTVLEGFRVHVVAVRYSAEELLTAGERLLRASIAGTAPPVAFVTAADDGAGLLVATPATVTASARTSVAVAAVLETAAGVPATVVTGSPPSPSSRQNDASAWSAGGLMEDPGFNPPDDLSPYHFCSTAFAVVDGGVDKLLSAKHCLSVAWRDGHHDPLTNGGLDILFANGDDTMIIDPIGTSQGRSFGGPWNAASTHSRYIVKVASAGSPTTGQSVCTSGANSGEHCGLTIASASMIQWSCNVDVCHGWKAYHSVSSVVATVGGDSGGPVYQNRSDGRVNARGIIHGGTVGVSCGSVRFSVGNCFHEVWFVDISRVLSHWGATIKTQA